MKYLSFLTLGETTGVSSGSLPEFGSGDEGSSNIINIPDGFPFGETMQTSVYVSSINSLYMFSAQ